MDENARRGKPINALLLCDLGVSVVQTSLSGASVGMNPGHCRVRAVPG
jgi:hypothetical protein